VLRASSVVIRTRSASEEPKNRGKGKGVGAPEKKSAQEFYRQKGGTMIVICDKGDKEEKKAKWGRGRKSSDAGVGGKIRNELL